MSSENFGIRECRFARSFLEMSFPDDVLNGDANLRCRLMLGSRVSFCRIQIVSLDLAMVRLKGVRLVPWDERMECHGVKVLQVSNVGE